MQSYGYRKESKLLLYPVSEKIQTTKHGRNYVLFYYILSVSGCLLSTHYTGT